MRALIFDNVQNKLDVLFLDVIVTRGITEGSTWPFRKLRLFIGHNGKQPCFCHHMGWAGKESFAVVESTTSLYKIYPSEDAKGGGRYRGVPTGSLGYQYISVTPPRFV